jgi:hypothetical protein
VAAFPRFSALFLLALWLLALAAVTACAEVVTSGSLSNGKFYTYSQSPASTCPDHWDNAWTDGVRLVDELYGGDYPWTNWVGWSDPGTVEITLDLGQPSSLLAIRVHCASKTVSGVRFPAQVSFLIRETTNAPWLQWGDAVGGPADTSSFSTAWLSGNGGPAMASQVKFRLTGSPGTNLFLDELDVSGWLTNRWKGAPRWGCYQGSFPAESADASSWFYSPAEFEVQSGKLTAGNLFYAAMGATTFAKVGANYATNLANLGFLLRSYDGSRFQQVGMNPPNSGVGSTAADVASGAWDAFFTRFFADYQDPGLRSGYNNLILLRLMNEFNGSWTAWSGDPDNYRLAFRRIYNIAQKLGVAGNFLWVWSPDCGGSSGANYAVPGYYPGDAYVDWVGLSLYPHSYFSGTNNMPTALINRVYPLYADRKPLMISEGGYYANVNQVEWIHEWFGALQTNFPMIKAFFWENHAAQSTGRRIDFSPATVAAYRAACQNPYFLPVPVSWEKNFHGINATLVNRDGWRAVAAPGNNPGCWLAGDAQDDGFPAACISGLTTGTSELYTLLPPESGDDYALGGELVDFVSEPTGRTSCTRLCFESSVDEQGNVLGNGWCVELTRTYTSSNWSDQLFIRDSANQPLAAAVLGTVSTKQKVPFLFQRIGSSVHVTLGSLSYTTTSVFSPTNNSLRLSHTVTGTGAPAGRFGVSGITMSSELAKREDFAGINGPMPVGAPSKWQAAAASADMPGSPTLFTNFLATLLAGDSNYTYLVNPMPAGKITGLSSGKMELFTRIPPQAAQNYRLTGSLLDYLPLGGAVNRGVQTRVWVECDIDAAGQVRRRGWSFVLRKVYNPASPADWYVRTEIRDPSDGVVLASNKGQPSTIYPVRFIFIRDGNAVTLVFGTLVYNAIEDYNPNNDKVSLYCRPELDGGVANSNETGFYDLRILYRTRPPAPVLPLLALLPDRTLVATGPINQVYELQAADTLFPPAWQLLARLTNLNGTVTCTNARLGVEAQQFFRLKLAP